MEDNVDCHAKYEILLAKIQKLLLLLMERDSGAKACCRQSFM
jgi:hypothetical protein